MRNGLVGLNVGEELPCRALDSQRQGRVEFAQGARGVEQKEMRAWDGEGLLDVRGGALLDWVYLQICTMVPASQGRDAPSGRSHAVNIPLHALPLRLAGREKVADVLLKGASAGLDGFCMIIGEKRTVVKLTMSCTLRCLSNSCRAKALVSSRVLGSLILRVERTMVR